MGTGKFPCITYPEINEIYDECIKQTISFTDDSKIKIKKYCNEGDLLITEVSHTLDKLATAAAYLGKNPCLLGIHVFCIKHCQNTKYLAYCLTTRQILFQKQKYYKKGIALHIRKNDLQKIKIPLPPLEIQEQIVEVLDAFRELVRKLINGLKAELKLRKKQYEYYLNSIISNVIEKRWVEWKTLGEIATDIYRGNEVDNSQIGTGNCPCIQYTEIYTDYGIWFKKCISYTDEKLIKNLKYCSYGDLLITAASNMSENIGKACTYLGNEKIIAGAAMFVLKHEQNPKYLAYALSTNNAKQQKQKHAKKGTLTNLATNGLKRIKIPLPPLEIQEQIANALDHLRELCEDLEKGIPKEIELANKRYEYYKELLIIGNKK
nr:restriction endonuclease subunit S [Candidatus Mycoplasma haemohominis]